MLNHLKGVPVTVLLQIVLSLFPILRLTLLWGPSYGDGTDIGTLVWSDFNKILARYRQQWLHISSTFINWHLTKLAFNVIRFSDVCSVDDIDRLSAVRGILRSGDFGGNLQVIFGNVFTVWILKNIKCKNIKITSLKCMSQNSLFESKPSLGGVHKRRPQVGGRG